MNTGLLEIAKIVHVNNAAAAGTTEIDSTAVDMTGFDAVCFVVDLAAVTDGSVMTLQVQQGATSTPTEDITGASATFTGATSSNSMLAAEAIRPTKRYCRAKFTRTTQNAAVNCILAILYKAKTIPITKDTTMLAQTTKPSAT